jgi:hypothetical protein
MGIQNALPRVAASGVGIRTNYATLLPPGSKVAAYVGAIQDDSLDAYAASTLLVPTLQAGLARCRSGKGDVVVVLPGHTETVSTADFFTNLVAGTQIIGVAQKNSSLMPTFTFSATAATFLLDVADVTVSGLKFVSSIDAVVNYLTTSAAGCKILDCVFDCGTSSALDVASPVLVNAGSDNLEIAFNRFTSLSTAVATNGVLVQGACQGVSIHDNDFDLSISGATSGLIEFGAFAIGQGRVFNNSLKNRRAAAAVCMRIADTAGREGLIFDNYMAVVPDITVIGGLISAAGSTNHTWRAFQNYGHDENIGTAVVTGIGTGTIE